MGYYNSIIGGFFFKESYQRKGFFNNLSVIYYWFVIFNNIIKLCINDYFVFDLRYYSFVIKVELGVSNIVFFCCCW